MHRSIFLLLFLFFLCINSNGNDFKIKIEKGPALDAGPNTFIGLSPVKDGVSLLSWLGGKDKIEKVLIGTPYINVKQQKFSEKYARERFEKAVCINSKAKKWHYAPYTMGTIYLKNGKKINFEMFLSGLKVGNILFATPKIKTKSNKIDALNSHSSRK